MRGVKVDISTDQAEVCPGGILTGVVVLHVGDTRGTPAEKLFLVLEGAAKTATLVEAAVPAGAPYTLVGTELRTESQEILSFDLQLAAFDGNANCGSHTFPFAMVLPPDLPAAMKVQGESGTECSIAYVLRVRLHHPGLYVYNAKQKHELKVFSPRSEINPTPLSGIGSGAVSRCCLTGGSVNVGFQADAPAANRNEILGVALMVQNDSTVSIKEMRIELFQSASWCTSRSRAKKESVVASVVIPGSALAIVDGGDSEHVLQKITNASRAALEELLRTGGATRHELRIPGLCAETMEHGVISVEHMFRIKAKTSRRSESLVLSAGIIVQQMKSAGFTQGGSSSVGVGSRSTSAPHPNAVGLDGDGRPIPAVVPRDAVKPLVAPEIVAQKVVRPNPILASSGDPFGGI